MKKIIQNHKIHWKQKSFLFSILTGFLFLAVSLVINRLASDYADKMASAYVKDIVLDNFRVRNVNFIVNDGAIIYIIFTFLYIIGNPKRIPFAAKSFALFVLIRSVFITLTHLGPMPQHSFLEPDSYLIRLNVGSDYFFSGHTGEPFLMALIFWDNKIVRYVSLAASLIFGAAVLLGHLHYSIDVLAAFFITFSIFSIAKRFFAKDWRIFQGKEVLENKKDLAV
jgi:membrane-associated phospholipid phosphatase